MLTIPKVVLHELAVRQLQVITVEDLSAHMVRVRLGGGDLETLASLGPTDHIKLLVPGEGEDEPEWPVIENGRIRFPSGRRPPLRDYTIRRHHVQSNAIDIDVAVHEAGHVSTWSRTASVGALVGTGGPRGSHPMPISDHYVLIGDLSSLPAVARWLEELPASATAQTLVAGAGPGDEIELQSRASTTIHWVHDESGVPADRLASSLDLLDLTRPDLYVWAAGEVLAMRSVRDWLSDEHDFEQEQVSVDGYWRRGEADYDHHRPLDD